MSSAIGKRRWVLHIEWGAPSPSADLREHIWEKLAHLHATPIGRDNRFTVRVTVEAESLTAAVVLATTDIAEVLREVGLTDNPVRIEAMGEAEFDAEQDAAARAAAVPELMSRQEIAEFLEVSPPRVNALTRTAAWRASVYPVQTLKSGTVYLADQVKNFASNWTRTPGRPSKGAR